MRINEKKNAVKMKRLQLLPLLGAVVLLGILLWLFSLLIAGVDREMHAQQLTQVRMVVEGLDILKVKALLGIERDLNKPEYIYLKEKLTAIRAANAKCRAVYLIGRRVEGSGFYFLSSEPDNSEA